MPDSPFQTARITLVGPSHRIFVGSCAASVLSHSSCFPEELVLFRMATYADIGKATKDLLTGHVYDHKLTYATKVQGVPVTANAIYKADGSQAYDVKSSYSVSGVNVEATINSTGKANVTATKAEVIKGLKLSATSAVYPQFSGAKATATYLVVPKATGGKSLVTKVDVGLTAAPKVESSVAYVHGSLTAGGEVEYDTAKRTAGKYSVGAQYLLKDVRFPRIPPIASSGQKAQLGIRVIALHQYFLVTTAGHRRADPDGQVRHRESVLRAQGVGGDDSWCRGSVQGC